MILFAPLLCFEVIGKIFDASDNIAKLISVSLFTFAATFCMNYNRPYASVYAATSTGSILFGSFYNGYEVEEYVPMRIMLIFVGVVTFLFVEMVMFFRSSRTIVQVDSIQFFEELEQFLIDSSKVCGTISSFHHSGSNTEEDDEFFDQDTLVLMLRIGHEKNATDDLTLDVETIKKTVARAQRELKPGIAEPSLGLNVPLDVVGYENLLLEQKRILSQVDLLIATIRKLIIFYSHFAKDYPARSRDWPGLLSASLAKIAEQLRLSNFAFSEAFPNGCRPGSCGISDVVRAVAGLRNFEDVTLAILADVEDVYATYLNHLKSGREVRYTPGFRLTISLSVSTILTIGRSLSHCGKHLETIVQSFPVEEQKSKED